MPFSSLIPRLPFLLMGLLASLGWCRYSAAQEAENPAASETSAAPIIDDSGETGPVVSGDDLETTYVVSGVRSESDWFSVPATVNVIEESTLEECQVRNLTEALERIPGVMVQKTANGQGSPYIRGFTGYRTLAMVDGVRYNNSVYRDGPSEYFSLIDVQAIESIELIQGPGSVLYGSDAIGGTLYLKTKSADFEIEPEGENFHHVTNYYRWHSAEQSHQERLQYQTGVGGKWGLHLGGTVKNFGDVKAAKVGEQKATGYDEWAYDVRFDAALSDQWTFTAAHQMLNQDDVWRTHSTIYGVSFAGSEIGSDPLRLKDQRRSLSYVKLRGEDLDGFVDTATLTGSYQTWHEEGLRQRTQGRRSVENFDSRMWGIDLQLESDSPFGRLTYGVDYYLDHVDTLTVDSVDGVPGSRRRAIQGPVGDDSTFGQFGVYLQDAIEVTERVDLLLGGRFTRVAAGIGQFEDPATGGAASYSQHWETGVGSVRITYDLDREERFKTFAGISQSFRAPNLADLSRYGGSRSDEIESAAIGLEPERFLTYEIGVKAQTELLSGQFSAYHTQISDFITSTPTGREVDGLREVTKQNSSEGYVQGIELSLSYELGHGFSLFGGLSYVEGEADTFPIPGSDRAVREPLSRIQPLIGTGGIRWTAPTENWWLELSVLAAGRADKLNSGDKGDTQRIPPGGTPSYTVLDLHAGWDISENFTLYGGLENLTDEAYRVHGSGSNEPGFGGVIGVKASF